MALSKETIELRRQREEMRRELENPTPEELAQVRDAAEELMLLIFEPGQEAQLGPH